MIIQSGVRYSSIKVISRVRVTETIVVNYQLHNKDNLFYSFKPSKHAINNDCNL